MMETCFFAKFAGATRRGRLALLVVAALTGGGGFAQEHSVRPGVNLPYANADVELWKSRFEGTGREVSQRRNDIVAALAVEPGSIVADVGAGTGLFTRVLSATVGPGGTLYALDITPNFIAALRQLVLDEALANVEVVQNSADEVPLPAGVVDLVFICATYHHFEFPQRMLGSISRALRSGGRLVIVDYKKDASASQWVHNHVRADRHEIADEVKAAGFELIEDKQILRENYFLEFRLREH